MTDVISVDRFRVDRLTLLWAGLFANGFLLLVGAYYLFSPDSIRNPVPILAPGVWIGASIWAVRRIEAPAVSGRRRLGALAVGAGYLAVLGFFGGLWGPGHPDVPPTASVTLFGLPPGWAPAVTVVNDWVRLSLLPFKVVGYLALAYLVYAAVLDAAGSAVSGLVGLFSCVSCTWPVIAAVASSLLGGTSAVAVAATNQSYLLSTVVFVATVGLLVWRPGWD